MLTSNVELSPKNGLVFLVLIVTRISTEHQDLRSLSDQETLCRQWIENNVGGRTDVRVIESQDSGELLDRQELRDLEAALETRQYDLLIVEDAGRICRRHRVHDIIELAIDNDTRVIAINDNVDTLFDDWKLKIGFAAMHHEVSNADTGKRIRRTLRSRHMQGLVVQCLPYGYIKPHPGASDQEVSKDPAAEPIIEEIFCRLERGVSYSVIVDWLNAEKIPTGRYVSSNRWTVSTLRNLVYNPLLKGVRVRNRLKSKRINKTGRRKSVKAPPEELLERKCPHLAFVTAERYDRLIRMLDKKNEPYRRKCRNGRDSRADVPKKRTRFPGQQVFCAVCGHPMQWGGHGQVDHMVCKGARDYHCWQSATFDGLLASAKILTSIYEACEQLPNFPETLQSQVREEFQALTNSRESERNQIEKRIDKLTRDLNRLVEFILNGKGSDFVSQKIAEIEDELEQAKLEQQELESRPSVAPVLPTSEEVRERAKAAIAKGSVCPYELSRVMRKLIPRIEAHPMRLCDGGAIVIRAKFQLHLCSLVPGLNDLTLTREVMTLPLEVDLFEPVQREAFRERVIALRDEGMKQRDIAAKLGITQAAVQYSVKLQATMDSLGLQDPYVPVTEAPMDLHRMRRHLHPRFKFEPYDPGKQE